MQVGAVLVEIMKNHVLLTKEGTCNKEDSYRSPFKAFKTLFRMKNFRERRRKRRNESQCWMRWIGRRTSAAALSKHPSCCLLSTTRPLSVNRYRKERWIPPRVSYSSTFNPFPLSGQELQNSGKIISRKHLPLATKTAGNHSICVWTCKRGRCA